MLICKSINPLYEERIVKMLPNSPNSNKVIIFDTTMRDGELTPGVQMNFGEKIAIAELLEKIGVDIIEVGYPGAAAKDFEEIWEISKLLKSSTICGLASAKADEIVMVAKAIAPASSGRIHTYTSVNLKNLAPQSQQQAIATIKESVSLARDYCDDVEWSAFDASRSDRDFLCRCVEAAIDSGATTVSIPDSLGVASPDEFSQLIAAIVNRVPNIDKAVISVHCHDDRGMAVENSIAALDSGARQIECSINGLGARKGNADLEELVREIIIHNYRADIDTSLLGAASDLVAQITKNETS